MTTEEKTLAAAVRKFLKDNDPEGFGCACEPGHTCGPCLWRARTKPLHQALLALKQESKS